MPRVPLGLMFAMVTLAANSSARAQEAKYPVWLFDEMVPASPADAATAGPVTRSSKFHTLTPKAPQRVGTNITAGAGAGIGAKPSAKPPYGPTRSLRLDPSPPPTANQPVKAPSKPR